METDAEIHSALPGVVWMVLALPPHLSSVGRENLVGSERAVLLRIPLLAISGYLTARLLVAHSSIPLQ